jgi:hypothetical protein
MYCDALHRKRFLAPCPLVFGVGSLRPQPTWKRSAPCSIAYSIASWTSAQFCAHPAMVLAAPSQLALTGGAASSRSSPRAASHRILQPPPPYHPCVSRIHQHRRGDGDPPPVHISPIGLRPRRLRKASPPSAPVRLNPGIRGCDNPSKYQREPPLTEGEDGTTGYARVGDKGEDQLGL